MTKASMPSDNSVPSAPRKRTRFWSILGYGLLVVYLIACAVVLSARYIVLPCVEGSKPLIESTLGSALNRPVTIGSLEAHWYRLRPYFVLNNIEIAGAGSAPALRIRQIVGVLSYRTLLYLSPAFSRISIDTPELFLEESAPRRLTLNGIPIPLGPSKQSSSFSGNQALSLFLHQRRIVVQNGTITYRNRAVSPEDLIFSGIHAAAHNGPVTKQYAAELNLPSLLGDRISVQAKMRPTLGHMPDNPAAWEGEIYGSLKNIHLAPAASIVSAPEGSVQGSVNAELWAGVKNAGLTSLRLYGAAGNLQLQFGGAQSPLIFEYIKGRVLAKKEGDSYVFQADPFSYDLPGAAPVENITLGASLTLNENGAPAGGAFSASHLDLKNLAGVLPALPLDKDTKELIAARRLSGTVENAEFRWTGSSPQLKNIEASAKFTDVSAAGQNYKPGQLWLPGFQHLTGSVSLTPSGGRLELDSPNSKLAFPGIFPVEYLEFDKLSAALRWDAQKDVTLTLESLSAENRDAAATVSGFYRLDGTPLGYINLEGEISRGRVPAAWKYVPLIAGDAAIDWLKRGLIAGTGSNGKLVLRGPLHEFPWDKSAEHDFSVTFDYKDGIIDVYPTENVRKDGTWVKGADWPLFRNVAGRGAFIKDSMTITAAEGTYQDARLKKAEVRIPAFSADTVLLTVDAAASGPMESFLDYVNRSVISTYTAGVFSKAQAGGSGDLDLALKLVLAGEGNNSVSGSFSTRQGAINFNQYLIPDMTDVSGKVDFSDKGVSGQNLSAKVFGEPVKGSLSTADNGDITVKANGSFPAKGLPQVLPKGLVVPSKIPNYLTGKAPFDLSVLIHGTDIAVDLKSSLVGMQSRLPAPLTKETGEEMPLLLKVKTQGSGLQVDLTHSGRLQANVELKSDRLTRAAFGIPKAPALPKDGISVLIQTPKLNADQWLAVKNTLLPKAKNASSEIAFPHFSDVQINVGELALSQFNQKDLKLSAKETSHGWMAHVESDLLNGEVEWKRAQAKTQPTLLAHFQKLYVPKSVEDAAEDSKPVDIAGGWPAIDAIVENLTYGTYKIGKVELRASNTPSAQGHLWQIKKFNVTNKDSKLISSGSWLKKPDGANRTTLLFDDTVTSLGGLLDRFGFPHVIKNGHGTIKGDLAWDGTPLSFNSDSFDGNLSILLNKGEILKIEPGAGAKLLSLLTLQSLTRYLTLDFRDFYSKGFTFDTIRGGSVVNDGVMDIKDLTMVGSSASVIINGRVSIPKESQNLNILVLPDINATGASVALAIANPVVGIGSFIAQMLFKDPLSKLFSFEYKVTGTWSDPSVKKIETQNTGRPSGSENLFEDMENEITKHF
jgi:uncharacterized protein (TIGR02099 family)